MPRLAPVIKTGAAWSAIGFLSAEVAGMTEFYVVRSRKSGWTKTLKVNQRADQIEYVVARIILAPTVTYPGMLIKTLCARFGCGCRRLSCPP
jgi:hypothetical protein